MSKRWNRTETWLTVLVIGVGGIILAVAGLWVYISATATPIHPDAAAIASVPAGSPAERWAASITQAREAVRVAASAQNLPGVSVAVGVDDALVWAEGFGWADIERKRPVTPASRFRLGTASTVLTSAGAGLLLERGRLRLDEDIRTYVPEFPAKPWPVRPQQVMGHLAGIPSDGGDESPLFGEHCDRPVEALTAFADRELRFEPGTQYRVSNFGWILVSAAIESASGDPFEIFMRKQVFEPLGMHDTVAESTPQPIPDAVTQYFPRFAADPRYGPDLMAPLQFSCYFGAGSFLSTASDLVRFGIGMQSGALLRPETISLLQTSQRLPSGAETGYGLGWDLETITINGRPTRVIGHDGEVQGGRVATFMTLPDAHVTIAVLANTSYADTTAIATRIAEAFLPARR